jgi:hypothetical protein
MHAKFPIAADLEIEVRSDKQTRSVEMTVVSGTNYEGPDLRKRDTYAVSPSTARAISSALMGAAAEV